MVTYSLQQLYLNMAFKLCQNIIIRFYQTKKKKLKSTVMTSFSKGSKEVILKLSMFMWIENTGYSRKKMGLFYCKHQAQATFCHLAKCWMLSSV